jgi:amino acid permease
VLGLPATTVILAATPPFAALCTLRDMRLLGPTSVSGTAVLALVLVMVLWDCYHRTEHGPRLRSHAAASPSALASFVAVSLFTFAGHTEVISVMRSMGAEVRWGRGAALLPTCYRLPTTAYCLLLTHCLLLTAYYYSLRPRRRATVPSRA